MTERRADEATRDVVAWLKCEYMSDHIGDEFTGTISAVTNFGLFVQLDDVYVDGLVHISSLQSDYYQYQEAGHRLVGERTRITYCLGDKMKIKVVRVSLDERKIDFELAGASDKKTDGGRRSKTSAKPGQRPPAKNKRPKKPNKSGAPKVKKKNRSR